MPRLKLTLPLDPWTGRAAPGCSRAARMRKLLTVVPFRLTAKDEAREAEIRDGVAHCLKKCGGCDLTDAWAAEKG